MNNSIFAERPLKIINFPDCPQSTLVFERVVRPAEPSDDFERIAELIYNSHPQVFARWFGNYRRGRAPLKQLIDTHDSLFSWQNIYVMQDLKTAQLIGAVLAPGQYYLTSDYARLKRISDDYRWVVEHLVEPLISHIKSCPPYVATVVACCVDPLWRGEGLGTSMLMNVAHLLRDKNIDILDLYCPDDNLAMLRICEKLSLEGLYYSVLTTFTISKLLA